jgi:hypothetical protein
MFSRRDELPASQATTANPWPADNASETESIILLSCFMLAVPLGLNKAPTRSARIAVRRAR